MSETLERDRPVAAEPPQSQSSPPVPSHRRGKRAGRQLAYHRAFIAPSVLVLLVLAAYPLLFIITAAFTRSSLGQPFQELVGVENFQEAAASEAIQDSLLLGAGYAVGVALASTALGTLTAVALWRSLKSGAVMRTVLLLPMIVPPVVVGILFSFIFSPSGGLIDTVIRRFTPGSGTYAILSDTTGAIFGVALADVWEWTPLVVLLVFTALLGQDPQLTEAAQLDGANGFQLFRYVTLPAVGGTIAAAFLIRLILAFKVFDLVYVMTSGGPGSSTQVPGYLIWRSALQNFDVGMAATITLLLAVVVTVITLPVFWITKRLKND